MRLVPELHTLTNPATRMQVTKLQHRQQQFLVRTETYLLTVPTSSLAANEYVDTNRLRELILTTSHPAQSSKSLFMAVSFMASKYAFLIRYWTQQCNSAQAAICRLSDTLGWVSGNAQSAHTTAARIKPTKASATHNHRATQIHEETQSTSARLTTTYTTQLRPSSAVGPVPKMQLEPRDGSSPKHQEDIRPLSAKNNLQQHLGLYQNPFASSDGTTRRKLKYMRSRLLQMVGDIWQDRNRGPSDLGRQLEPESPLPHLPPHQMLPTPFSHQSALWWLDAILRRLQDTAWDRWQYRNGIQLGTQEPPIFKNERKTRESHYG